MEGTLKTHIGPSALKWAGTSSNASGCSELHPAWPWMFPGIEYPPLSGQSVPFMPSLGNMCQCFASLIAKISSLYLINPASYSLNFWQLISNLQIPSTWDGLKKIRKMPNVTSAPRHPCTQRQQAGLGGKPLLLVLFQKKRASQTEHMELPCFQHFSSLSHPGIFGQLLQARAVLLLSQILFPWHVLLPSTESQPVLQITCIDPKTFVREKLPYLLHSLDRDAPHCSVPSSAGIQDKLSALETEIAGGLILPCCSVTMQRERSLRATSLAWCLPSLCVNSQGFQQRLACN